MPLVLTTAWTGILPSDGGARVSAASGPSVYGIVWVPSIVTVPDTFSPDSPSARRCTSCAAWTIVSPLPSGPGAPNSNVIVPPVWVRPARASDFVAPRILSTRSLPSQVPTKHGGGALAALAAGAVAAALGPGAAI